MTETATASHVTTTAGIIEGDRWATSTGDMHRFLGLPFAHTDAAGRFLPPLPPRPWTGVREAHDPAPAAPQNPDPVRQMQRLPLLKWDEDGSLVANIWTPGLTGSRPIMVWVHGGAYVSGAPHAAVTDGAVLAERGDVVVVALAYRLGAFGFLHLGDHLGDEYGSSGNTALQDLVAGLEWVRDNAAAFGGDPGRVTLFGESAGAAAVGTLLGMSRAEGLFSRAIMQSGTAERVRSRGDAAEVTDRLLHAAGLTTAQAEALCRWPAARVLEAQSRLVAAIAAETLGVPLPFMPVIDGVLLPQTPLDAIRSGGSREVSLIAGTNLNEASFTTALLPADARDEGALAAMTDRTLSPHGIYVHDYAQALEADLGRSASPIEVLEAALTDIQYRQPTERLLDARAAQGSASYSYLFTWSSPAFSGALGTPHALDLPFVFDTLGAPEVAPLVGDDPPRALATSWSGAWAGFARAGVPAADGLPNWPVHAAEVRRAMVFDEEPHLADDPRGTLRRLWAGTRTHCASLHQSV